MGSKEKQQSELSKKVQEATPEQLLKLLDEIENSGHIVRQSTYR